MKTIKMIADELNVTKQTIVNNAKNLNITFEKKNGVNYINEEDYLKIVNKINKKERVFINNDEEKIQEHNKEETKEFLKEPSKTSSVEEKKLKMKINELEKQIENFKTRSEKDNTYIETLTEQLNQQNSNVNTLNRLLENQQILALESNKKIQRLESELEEERQLNYSSNNAHKNEKYFNTETVKDVKSNNEDEFVSPDSDDVDFENNTEKDNIEIRQNNNDNNHIYQEQQSKKGFWSRLFGN
ncbi:MULTISPECIES: DUF536 domain-containing protein [Bacilli]|uniref:DUF536 domain-containing protein n=1 Tax=Bacilli TaxID=91061 RepID=UPI0005E273BC|nr:DUF536 domain-containing protein [Streptococcus pneumoniae]CIV76187.1 Protein of uncharacterised function%2C DUF536 [Streptococcus pneumoniae]CIV76212.1 Protein of uncharacterised function%2C DUF536 [Streptococcus pneumoniae]